MAAAPSAAQPVEEESDAEPLSDASDYREFMLSGDKARALTKLKAAGNRQNAAEGQAYDAAYAAADDRVAEEEVLIEQAEVRAVPCGGNISCVVCPTPARCALRLVHLQDVGAADDMGADFNAQQDDDEGEVYFGEEAAMQEVDQAYVNMHTAQRSMRTCTFVLACMSPATHREDFAHDMEAELGLNSTDDDSEDEEANDAAKATGEPAEESSSRIVLRADASKMEQALAGRAAAALRRGAAAVAAKASALHEAVASAAAGSPDEGAAASPADAAGTVPCLYGVVKLDAAPVLAARAGTKRSRDAAGAAAAGSAPSKRASGTPDLLRQRFYQHILRNPKLSAQQLKKFRGRLLKDLGSHFQAALSQLIADTFRKESSVLGGEVHEVTKAGADKARKWLKDHDMMT